MALGRKAGLVPRDILLDGDSAPTPPKGGGAHPQFSTHFYCGIKMPLGMDVGLSPGDFVLDGDPSSPPPKGAQPLILAHVCCGKMAGCIKMPLGMEVGLDPGHIVLDGNPAPLPKGDIPPIFGPYLLRPNGWMDQDATWYGGRP